MPGLLGNYRFIRHLQRPLTATQLVPLDADCRTVQFNQPLTLTELRRVAGFLPLPSPGYFKAGEFIVPPDIPLE
jgi:hypothetical protein